MLTCIENGRTEEWFPSIHLDDLNALDDLMHDSYSFVGFQGHSKANARQNTTQRCLHGHRLDQQSGHTDKGCPTNLVVDQICDERRLDRQNP